MIRRPPRSPLFPYPTLFRSQEKLNPVALFAWAGASIVGYAVQWGIPALNSLLCAAVLYYSAMKIVAMVQRQDRVRSEDTRLNSSHANISYAVFCLKKKKNSG